MNNYINACALNTSAETLFLDHISPLASLLKIPLIVTNKENAQLTAKYYPEVKVRYWPDLEFRLHELAEEFDALIECNYWEPHLKQLFRLRFKKEMRLIFCPHGQSDKGFLAPSLAPYALQETILLYGNLMKEMLQELKIWDKISSHAQVGNFRLNYYEGHKARLFRCAQEEIFSLLSPSNHTLLYAPTWNDDDRATSFFAYGKKLIQELPNDWNLIIKVHPLLVSYHPHLFYPLSSFAEKQRNCIITSQFPPIYPLLDKIDAYLGDYSSIGYDLLIFQKPMFFLEQSHLSPMRLHSCGKILDPSKNLFQSIEKGIAEADGFRPLQAALYKKAFAPVENIQKTLFEALK